jgi:RNA polymerase sigma-70 factor (ECF subfamily)
VLHALEGPASQTALDAAAVIETAEAMYRLHHARIHSLCMSFLRNEADAEDAVQESFARLARRLPTLAGDPSAYLTVIARNVCRDELRRRLHHGPEVSELLEASVSTESRVIDRRTLQDIWDQLTPRERLLLTHQLAGYRMEEIAQFTGLTINAATVGVSRARTRARLLAARAQAAMVGLPAFRLFPQRLRAEARRLALGARQLGAGLAQSSLVASTALAVAIAVPAASALGPNLATRALPAGGAVASLLDGQPGTAASATLGQPSGGNPGGPARPEGAPGQTLPLAAAMGLPVALPTGLLGPINNLAAFVLSSITVSPSFASDHTIFATGSVCGSSCPPMRFVSLNGGHTWSRLVPAPEATTGIDLGGPVLLPSDFGSSNALTSSYYYTASSDGLVQNTLIGSHQVVLESASSVATVLPGSKGDLVIGENPLVVYHSQKQTAEPGPALTAPGATVISMAGIGPDTVLVLADTPQVPHPTSAIQTTQPAPTTPIQTTLLSCHLDQPVCTAVWGPITGGNSPTLLASPNFATSPNLAIYIPGQSQVWYSPDAGKDVQLSHLPSNQLVQAMAFGPSGQLLMAQSGGTAGEWSLSQSQNGGASFSVMESGSGSGPLDLNLDSLAMLPNGNLLGGMALIDRVQHGGLRCTADAGRSWTYAC